MGYQVYRMVVFSWLLLAALPALAQVDIATSRGALDEQRLAAFVNSVEPYIKEWPPRFRDQSQRAELLNSVASAIKQLSKIDLSAIKKQQVLVDVAHLYAMAHNLDFNTAAQAKSTFEKAIAIDPNDRRTNYRYGMFLISTRAFHFESLPYLEKALELGEKDALFSIGLLQIEKGNKEKGLAALERYLQEHPESQHTRKVIQAVKDGKLTFQQN
ncbi:MAG TPA: tetratricopeptide repeat protein [Rhodocyclaceae bacterium]|nr:tetratricopeptide repeat protein [Rhodocyclaceae bacterium]